MKSLEMIQIEIEDLEKQFNELEKVKTDLAALIERVDAIENSLSQSTSN